MGIVRHDSFGPKYGRRRGNSLDILKSYLGAGVKSMPLYLAIVG